MSRLPMIHHSTTLGFMIAQAALPGRPALMAHTLHNYLRTYRKRAGLSQDEVAFLLGVACGTKVSRYECWRRQPGLTTAFAYEVLFGASSRKLFGGLFRKVETVTVRRARILVRKLSVAARDPLTARKLDLLRAITSGSVSEPGKNS
jgi:DNA-binding XRE family transcriptional regulator